jgi:hypothetical protein
MLQSHFTLHFLPLFAAILFSSFHLHAQVPGPEATNWYFGIGTDGLAFPGPVHNNSKFQGMGFEGMVVVNDPATGNLRFYSDGATVRDANNNLLMGGSGLNGNYSGTQCIQALRMNCNPDKYWLLTNTAYDMSPGNLYYSVVDFTINPNGQVTNLNTPVTTAGYYNEGNFLVNRPGTSDYWWIAHVNGTATYHVFSISGTTITGPTPYTFTRTGDATTMAYSPASKRLAVAGYNMGLILLDLNPQTGVLSNEDITNGVNCALGDFSPDGKKLYFSEGMGLSQLNLSNGAITSLNTCCYAHDTQRAPDGKMYHIHTYNSMTPLSVIEFPNLPGTACGYTTLPIQFSGHVRRFPEFVSPCDTVLTRVNSPDLEISTLAPNPVTSLFELDYPLEAGNVTSVEILDQLGRMVHFQMESTGTHVLQFDVSSLAQGFYSLRVTFDHAEKAVYKRFLKQ